MPRRGRRSGAVPVLVVEDEPRDAARLREAARRARLPAPSRRAPCARRAQALQPVRPAAIVLDILLGARTRWEFLAELKSHDRDARRSRSSSITHDRRSSARALALGADAYASSRSTATGCFDASRSSPRHRPRARPDHRRRRRRRATCCGGISPPSLHVIEAHDGAEGLALAAETQTGLILLDLAMPGMSGFDVLRALRADASSRATPVIVATSKNLPAADRRRSMRSAAAVMQKDLLAGEGARPCSGRPSRAWASWLPEAITMTDAPH